MRQTNERSVRANGAGCRRRAVRVVVGGAGGAASNGFIRSLRASGSDYEIIGTNSSPADLLLAEVDERYVVPPATSESYAEALLQLLESVRPEVLHVQNDDEVRAISALAPAIRQVGVGILIPPASVVARCQDKWSSYLALDAAGVRVPRTRLIESQADLRAAFRDLEMPLWLRERRGAAGLGSARTSSFDFAKAWIEHRGGWGRFTAADYLSPDSVTWQSIWFGGELVVAQTRRRLSWAYANNSVSGVSGITAVGVTWSNSEVDELAERAVHVVAPIPHGIFGVDMTLDRRGEPAVTEVNPGRFFTTHEFFTRAGLNMPQLYVDLVLGKRVTYRHSKNPLRDGLAWIRGMDVLPRLVSIKEIGSPEIYEPQISAVNG